MLNDNIEKSSESKNQGTETWTFRKFRSVKIVYALKTDIFNDIHKIKKLSSYFRQVVD